MYSLAAETRFNSTDSLHKTCPLCFTLQTNRLCTDNHRDYLRCQRCQLTFVPPIYHLSIEKEKARYDEHKNSPEDPQYREFLSKLLIPMVSKLTLGDQGLDFGSGPGPTLSIMFREAGYPMEIYDYFYAPNTDVLNRQYDFITATEVIEHLRHPIQTLNLLWKILKPGGVLGIMTETVPDHKLFSEWYYKRDPTHICFFSYATFTWLSKKLNAAAQTQARNIMLLSKPVFK